MSRLAASYVLPLRWDDATDAAELAELTGYLRALAARVEEVVVVDGSAAPVFERHADAWGGLVRHLRPDPRLHAPNGKVAGLTTGVVAAHHDRVVVADDDVRWDAAGLERAIVLLDDADVLRPQNVFQPRPWHARWDTARTLLNRAVAADYPGTFALRRSTFAAMGGYRGDALFENLEMLRTFRVHGAVERRAPDLFVVRRPPSARRFGSQRVRQAYDDLAQPWRLALLPAAPLAVASLVRGRRRPVVAAATVAVGVAEVGRWRDGGRRAFPVTAALWAPAWLLERSACQWVALCWALRGGVPYAGSRLRVAASSTRELRRRWRDGVRGLAAVLLGDGPAGGAEPGEPVGAVAEGLAPGLTAPAERDRGAAGVDRPAVGVEQLEVAADDERPVAVRGDGGACGSGHLAGVPADGRLIRSRRRPARRGRR